MDPDELRLLLWTLLGVLERGDWRAIVRPPGFGSVQITGPGRLVRLAMVLSLVARSMHRQSQGRLLDAWDRLSEAASLLPPQFFRRDPSTGVAYALLRPMPPDGAPVEERLVVAISRLIWREQFELLDLQCRFAPGRMKARDELIEGCILYLIWVTFDPTTLYRTPAGEPVWDDGVAVEPSRAVLCLFGTEIRWLADPAQNTKVSQAPWQDIGGYRGLCAEAFDALATRPEPAPWCGGRGTSGLVVRRGRLRAWQHARRRTEDLLPA